MILNYLFLVKNIFTTPRAINNIPNPIVPYTVELPVEPSFVIRPIIPAIIIPPLTRRSRTTTVDFSLSEIAKAAIDRITAPPPNTPPLTAADKWRVLLFSS